MKKSLFVLIFSFICFFGYSQRDINNYKYIIVPKKFEFSKSEDQHQLNSILKFLFNKYGYKAYFPDDELPEDLKNNRCLALKSEVSNDEGGMFKTKLEIILKDCYEVEVMRSDVGESRLKQFDRAYNEALRDAFKTFQELDYSYISKEGTVTKEEDIKVAKFEKETVEVIEEAKPIKEVKKEVVDKSSDNEEVYYAQPKSGGYQLVDSEPKVVMFLLSTSAQNVFLVKDKNAIVYKEDGFWYYSENDGELKEPKVLNIKF